MELIDLEALENGLQKSISLIETDDVEIPAKFKQEVTSMDEGTSIKYNTHTFIYTNKTGQKIYFPNQCLYIASCLVDLYGTLIAYKEAISSIYNNEIPSKESINKEVIINSDSYTNEEKDFLVLFVSDYSWWKGGKGIERGDFWVSPVLAIANVINASQNFIADLAKYLYENPNHNILLKESLQRQRNVHDSIEFHKLSLYNYLYKYIAAIKSKPFLLLAGISGTGKSRIVRQLARACDKFDSEPWEVQKPYNYEMISVKPNWHDSTELLGYISRVSGKPHYIVTDFLKFIVKAWMYEDKPFFLCLDEMNLAPVEQYFAEFLSVMESRKLINETNVITSDPLLYLSSSSEEEEEMTTNMINDLFSKVECYGNSFEDDGAYHARLESLKEKFKKEGISIPRNLIVIGTVNMDETTYTFSRKVLDRAMTIEMNEVILTDGLNRGKEILPDIAPEWILPDAVEGYDFYDKNSEVCDYVIEYLEKINEKLECTPFKIAYRTRNDCMLYVVNSLKLCQESDGLTKDNIRDRALDEVTSMKILSRIEGDKKKVGETLSELEKVIREQFDLTDSDEDRAKSVSLKKLKEMNDRLTNTYYCSFWS